MRYLNYMHMYGKVRDILSKYVLYCILSCLYIDIVRLRNYREAVCKVFRVWLWMRLRIVKPQILDQCCHEDEQTVPGEALPHAHPPPHAVRDELVPPDQPQPGLRLLQEPLWSEHLRLGPHRRVLHEAPQVGHGVRIFGDNILSNLALLRYPAAINVASIIVTRTALPVRDGLRRHAR